MLRDLMLIWLGGAIFGFSPALENRARPLRVLLLTVGWPVFMYLHLAEMLSHRLHDMSRER
jgi:hypothetical protein